MFENTLARRGRLGEQKRDQLLEYANIIGVNYADSIYTMAANQSPYARNVDFGDPIGCITKRKGYESLITSLGAGKVLGLNNWQHSVGDKMLMAWGNDLYVLGGTVGSVAKSNKADWEAGAKVGLDTDTSEGDLLLESGIFSEVVTATADFDGAHNNTVAVSDKVTMESTAVSEINIASATYNTGTMDTSGSGQTFTSLANTTNIGRVRVNVRSFSVAGTLTCSVYTTKAKTNLLGSASVSVDGTGDKDIIFSPAVTIPASTADLYLHFTWTGTMGLGYSNEESSYAGGSYVNSSGTSLSGRDLYFMAYHTEPRTGVYTHGVIYPSAEGLEKGIYISYDKTEPANSSATVQHRLSSDSGATWGDWEDCASGDILIPPDEPKTGKRLQWRINFLTWDANSNPSVEDVSVRATKASYGTWISPVYDLNNSPTTATMAYSQTVPEGCGVKWYVRSSNNDTIFGDWHDILASGNSIPIGRYIQVKCYLTSPSPYTATPTASGFIVSYSTGYTVTHKLDISPLGRVDNLLSGNSVCFCNYEDWCLVTDGLRPFLLYITDNTQETGTAQAGGASTITLKAGASDANNFYTNAFVTITIGTGAGQTRWITGYDGTTKEATVSVAWDTIPDNTSEYSIGSAVKVRNLGVDPPETAPSGVAGDSGNPNGAYKLMVTYVNADGVESNPSPASELVTVSSKKIVWTIPTDSSTGNTTVKRRLYRTADGGAVYKYLTEVANNTTATYLDNRADAALGSLMLDNNNVPPASCSLIFTFTSYVFYVTEQYYVRFSKAGAPDQCPYTESDIQELAFPGEVLDMKSSPIALIFGGKNFLASVTSNGGFIFDSDPMIDTTTMKLVDTHGGMSYRASAMCISPNLKSTLVVNTDVGLRSIIPGLQDNSIESVPFSKNIQKYYDRSINREQAAAVFYNNYYIYSMEYLAEGAAESEFLTFVYDFRTEQWYGPWTFGMVAYTVQGNDLYAGDTREGKLYKMFTGNTDAGADILMECDLPMRAPGSEAGTCKFKRLMGIIHGDSTTTDTLIKPKVDEAECTIPLGPLATTFTGDERPGHDFIRTRKYGIGLPRGHTYSLRIIDDSVNPLRVMKIITEYEVLPLRK